MGEKFNSLSSKASHQLVIIPLPLRLFLQFRQIQALWFWCRIALWWSMPHAAHFLFDFFVFPIFAHFFDQAGNPKNGDIVHCQAQPPAQHGPVKPVMAWIGEDVKYIKKAAHHGVNREVPIEMFLAFYTLARNSVLLISHERSGLPIN